MAKRRIEGYRLVETPYGFEWGPALVSRCVSDEKLGVVLEIKTPFKVVRIRISPTGRVIEVGEKRHG